MNLKQFKVIQLVPIKSSNVTTLWAIKTRHVHFSDNSGKCDAFSQNQAYVARRKTP